MSSNFFMVLKFLFKTSIIVTVAPGIYVWVNHLYSLETSIFWIDAYDLGLPLFFCLGFILIIFLFLNPFITSNNWFAKGFNLLVTMFAVSLNSFSIGLLPRFHYISTSYLDFVNVTFFWFYNLRLVRHWSSDEVRGRVEEVFKQRAPDLYDIFLRDFKDPLAFIHSALKLGAGDVVTMSSVDKGVDAIIERIFNLRTAAEAAALKQGVIPNTWSSFFTPTTMFCLGVATALLVGTSAAVIYYYYYSKYKAPSSEEEMMADLAEQMEVVLTNFSDEVREQFRQVQGEMRVLREWYSQLKNSDAETTDFLSTVGTHIIKLQKQMTASIAKQQDIEAIIGGWQIDKLMIADKLLNHDVAIGLTNPSFVYSLQMALLSKSELRNIAQPKTVDDLLNNSCFLMGRLTDKIAKGHLIPHSMLENGLLCQAHWHQVAAELTKKGIPLEPQMAKYLVALGRNLESAVAAFVSVEDKHKLLKLGVGMDTELLSRGALFVQRAAGGVVRNPFLIKESSGALVHVVADSAKYYSSYGFYNLVSDPRKAAELAQTALTKFDTATVKEAAKVVGSIVT